MSYALLTDGSTIQIRPATPHDTDAVRAMHAAMSPDNIYLRFFSMSPAHADYEARRVCRPPGSSHVALLAWFDGHLAGVASYELAQDNTAEIAFAVDDAMHGRGIATLLLDHLVSIARQHHVRAFTAEVLAGNAAMLGVFADAGLPVRRQLEDGIMELFVPLPAGDGDAALLDYLDAVSRRDASSDVASLRHLLMPQSIAVVGASKRAGAVGSRVLHNILASGFAGRVYPVNPHADMLAGLSCLSSAGDLPEHVDVAVIAVPAAAVPDVACQCGMRGVRSLVVLTSGLGDSGNELVQTCRRHGMRLVGPNCFGIAVPDIGLDATFGRDRPLAGIAGLAVQSGGIGISLTEHLSELGVGVSSFISVGDKRDVSSNDLLTWWEQDGQTAMAILYLESFGNPRKFAQTARRVAQRMPILTVVGGRSAAGQRAAQSHTAAAASPFVTRQALFAQAGVIVAGGLGELVDVAALLACQPVPAGDRVVVVSNAGGAGVLAADACADAGLRLASLSSSTLQRLAEILPAGATIANPVDTTAAVVADRFRACLEAVAADEAVDAVLSLTVPTAMADLAQAVLSAEVGAKPLCAAALEQPEGVRLIPRAGRSQGSKRIDAVPCYAYPEAAAHALGHAARYGAWLTKPHGSVPELPGARSDEARQIVARFLSRNQAGGWLPATMVSELLACYQIPQVATVLTKSEQEALTVATGLGGAVVLKAEAGGLVHKTEAGAVKLDLRGPDEVAGAYRELAAEFGDALSGVLVQPMLRGGTEILIGVTQEPVFGPLVVFGAGGTTTEILADHAARLTPLTDTDARELIRGVKAARLLDGYRGLPPADKDALADVLLRVSRLAGDLPELAALDLNPVIAGPHGCLVADARIQIVPGAPHDPYLRQLR
ncbi:MAG TPA: bifunctional GNAT family N-acetyltransferase/acetate--CoA ligase family protein [Streptosporangiaceae bacterium]|nr:bifunctional GNAT family N-acetyltransferase/acetate--CoA ligase family protein [Streptosporangiaceae bacterium]